mgnify:CR=1 FL=1
MTKSFSIKEAISFGWNVINNNLGFFIKLFILIGFIYVILALISFFFVTKGDFSEENKWILFDKSLPLLLFSSILSIVRIIISILITMGFIKISLKFYGNEKANIFDLFSSSHPLFFKYLIGNILYSLIVFLGLILLIIPGIIWSIKFQFFAYLIVDKGLGPIQALKESSKITKDNRWHLFLFEIVILFINILGFLAFRIGLFITIPITFIAYAYVYRQLLFSLELSDIPPELIKIPDELNKNI